MAISGLGTGFDSNVFSPLRQLGVLDRAALQQTNRLSSGRRVGGAGNSDNSALIGIVTQFANQVRGLSAAADNVAAGVNLAQVAEGGLEETSDLLGRARELAVQASNDTLTASDRAALQEEFSQIQQEIDRTANSTQFNTQSLLNGTTSSVTIQTGANGGQSSAITLPDATAAALGVDAASADISTQAGANAAIGQIDAAIDQVSAARGQLGAQQSALESAGEQIAEASINQAAAESRIGDADFAAEISNLMATRLRQQFAYSVLAQSNVSAGAVLRLFGQQG